LNSPGVAHGHAAGVRLVEQRAIEGAGHRATAKKRGTEAHALLVAEADDFERVRQSLAATVQIAYDQVDFSRGIDAFLTGMSATSVYAICHGLEEAGVKSNQGIGMTEQLLDARSLFLTPNTTTIYVLMCVNLKDGPVVVRVPPRALGPADDADFRWVTDVGLTGPDKGAGGDYLFIPPGYKGAVPATGFNVAKPLGSMPPYITRPC